MPTESEPSQALKKLQDLRYFNLLKYQYHVTTPEEVKGFEDVVGIGVVATINNLGTVLLTDEDFHNKKVKKLNADTDEYQELLGILNGKYTRSDFVFVLNQRLVNLCLWKANKPRIYPQRVVQLDFMFFLDWLDENQGGESYQKVKSESEIGGNGLGNDAITFLRKLKRLAMVVDRDCHIQLSPADEQRERVFRMLLTGRPNVNYGDKKT